MRFLGELATGNPVLVGYLAYIVGLMVTIAARGGVGIVVTR
jgi:hypothetical protein